MGQVEVKAHELKDVEVGFVSLVKRGANRIPFRILKEDTGMAGFDLSTFMFRKADADEASRQAVAKTDAVLAQAMEILKSAGYSVAKLEPASDGDGTDTTKNPADGTDAGGTRSTGEGSDDTKNPAEGTEAGGKRNDGGATELVKADDEVVEEDPKAKEAEASAEAEEVEDPKKKKTNPFAEKDPAATETVEKSDMADLKALFQKSVEDLAAGFASRMDALGSRFDTVGTQITAVEARIAKAEQSIGEVGTAVVKTDKFLSGLVPHRSTPDQEVRFAKSGNSLPPPLDTGYMAA